MIPTMIEAAFRSMALAVLVWAALTAARLGVSLSRRRRWTSPVSLVRDWRRSSLDPRVEGIAWTMVLVGALSMPLIMQARLPVVPAAAFILPDVTIRALHDSSDTYGYTTLVLIYCVASAIFLARLAIGFGRLWIIRSRAVRVYEPWTEGADVRVSDRVPSPVTFGSTIVFPATYKSWSVEKRSIILAHELSHARHADCQVQWLAAIHECLFWFSPLPWWLRRHLADVAEQVSDDSVLRSTVHRADYAAVLLEVAQERTSSPVAMSIGSGRIAKRIERILASDRPVRRASRLQCATVLAFVIPVIAVAAQADRTTEPPLPGPANLQPPTLERPHSAMTPGTTEPYIVTAKPLEEWYPEEAKRHGIEGLVKITVTVDTAGRATDTHVVSEYPDGEGFAAAASGMVHTFTYANPTGHPASLTFAVKFALDHGHPTGSPPSGSDNPVPSAG